MWFELMLIPFALVLILFIIFFTVSEGSRWQKHRFLGPFARFIQASPARGFVVFLILTIGMIPAAFGVLHGFWIDTIMAENTLANTVPIVNTLLVTFLLLALSIPVMWSHFRTWRQSVRSAADVRVRTTQK